MYKKEDLPSVTATQSNNKKANILANSSMLKLHEISTSHNTQKPPIIQRFYDDAYSDYLGPHFARTTDNIATIKTFVDSLVRPNWYSDTRDSVLGRANFVLHREPYRTLTGEIDSRPAIFYECQCCHTFTPYAGIDIGHIIPWKDYLKQVGASNLEEAKIAYNELENLRVECTSCNRSHDFECVDA